MPRTAPVLAALFLLAGCATSSAGGRMLAAGGSATLAPGESVTFPDASTLTYRGVQRDSRCPPRVQCIHAGSAAVAFDHFGGQAVLLETGKTPSALVGRWRIQLLRLDFGPSPRATIRLDPAS